MQGSSVTYILEPFKFWEQFFIALYSACGRPLNPVWPIDTETIEKFISNISRSLEELGQSEISTNTIGTMVMDGLKDLDPVGYVRFASVYRNFREEKDFVQFVDKLNVYKKS